MTETLVLRRETSLTLPVAFLNAFEHSVLYGWNAKAQHQNLPGWISENRTDDGQGNTSVTLLSSQPKICEYIVLGAYQQGLGFIPVYATASTTELPPETALATCEVCNTKRARKNLILEDPATGVIHVVGYSPNCYNTFMNKPLGKNPPPMQYLLSDISEALRLLVADMHAAPHTSPAMALGAALHYTRLFGYVSKQAAEQNMLLSTARHIEEGIFHQRDPELQNEVLTGAIFLQELLDLQGSEDFNELSPLLKSGIESLTGEFVTRHSLGVIAIVPTLYMEYLNKKKIGNYGGKAFGEYTDAHVGSVGERMVNYPVLVERVLRFPSGFGQGLIVFKDRDGRKITWITEVRDVASHAGVEILLTGRVKEHKEYQGAKETRITHGNIHIPQPSC